MARRLWPLTGVAFFIVWLLGFALHGGASGDSTSTSATVSYYMAHQGALHASIVLWIFAAVLLVPFAAYLQTIIAAKATERSPLASAVLAGGTIWGAGILITVFTHDALLQAAIHGQSEVAAVANGLAAADFAPIVGGIAIFCLAAGLANVRGGPLPSWLGWVGVVVGLLAVAGPLGIYAFLGAPVWVLIAGAAASWREFTSARQPAALNRAATPV